jgi:uncharacterized membrane protein
METEDKELKREFELERVILFSDAVFAILLTIMVLDIKLPDGLRHATPEQLKHVYFDLFPKFFAYILSFFLVSTFWIRHLSLFKQLTSYDKPLIVLNLIFLFCISLFPFAISTISGIVSLNNIWNIDVYVTIILISILTQSVIGGYMVKHRYKLCYDPETIKVKLKWKIVRLTYFMVPVALVLIVILTVLKVYPPVITYVLAGFALMIRIAKKRFYPKQKALAQNLVEVTS